MTRGADAPYVVDSGRPRTQLLVITDGHALADETCEWLDQQFTDGVLERVTGFYAAVTALTDRAAIIVMDASLASPRDEWQLASLRTHCSDVTVVVLAAEPRLSALAGALQADLAVPDTSALPPLRELLVGPSAVRLPDGLPGVPIVSTDVTTDVEADVTPA